MWLCAMASCVSGASVYLLLRLRMSLQNLEGFVLWLSEKSVCFHMSVCSCFMSSCISLLSVESLLIMSCVGGSRLSWLRRCILCLMFLLKPGV